MKWKVLQIFSFIIFAAVTSFSQSTPDCPVGFVCISPEAARKALENADTVEAQRKEILALMQAIADQKGATADVKIALAQATGEKTQLEIANLRLNGNLEVCMKKRGVKVGLINF